jgi:hypothetical protein
VNNEGLTLGLFAQPPQCIESRNELEIRKWARALAESRSAGLIEVRLTDVETRIVFKELEMPTYYYTGVLITRVNGVTAHWTMTACELGMTGVREAVVTSQLFTEGKLSPNEYEGRFAQDPYEPSYHGVDRKVLRFMSDDERYDETFPEHPLSKVRRLQAILASHVKYDF